MSGERRIEAMALGALQGAKRNPKQHSSDIRASVGRFGYVEPIVLDERTGRIVAGHGRREALQAMRKRGEAAPAGVEERDGEWFVPVLRGWASRSDAEAEAYLLASNKLTEAGGWDNEALAELLKDLDAQDALDGVGFDAEELEALINYASGTEGLADQDEVPEEPNEEEVYVKPGDIWLLGKHRLLCGDSTSAEVVGRLMGAERAQALVFDPPWDLSVPTPIGQESALVFTDGRRAADAVSMFGPPSWLFVWDCVSCWYTPNRPLQRAKLCFWYGAVERFDFNGSHYGDAGEPRQVFNSRGSYEFTPDPRGKHLADVFSAPITKLHSDSEHPHSKPVDWVRMLIADCTTGDVFDPFLGSGTSLIACEQIGRRCLAIELEPKYVQVAIERWQKFTGKQATKA